VVYGFQQNQRQEYDYVPLSGRSNPELDLTLSTQTLTAELHHHLRPGMVGTAGVQSIAQVNTWKGQFLIPNFASEAGGAFITERFQLHNFTLEAGARLDSKSLVAYFRDPQTQQVYSRTRQFWRPSLSLGAEYTLGQVLLAAQIASAWRPPSANELYSNGVHQSAVSFEKGNATLKSEQAYTASFTASYAKGPWQAEATLYANQMPGYIYLRPDSAPVKTVRGAFPAFTYTQTNALLLGADLQAKYTLTPAWQLLHKSSWLRGQDLSAHTPLIFMPTNRLEHSLRYQPKGVLSKTSTYAQATISTVLRQNRFPSEVDYTSPPAAYTLVNLETGITLPQKTRKGLTLIASVTNLLNTTYRDYLNRFRYFMPEAGRGFALRASLSF
jgi:iron complex outermembrane receptor protein